eukprot:885777-Pleurochrysis_carterae.AAC.1
MPAAEREAVSATEAMPSSASATPPSSAATVPSAAEEATASSEVPAPSSAAPIVSSVAAITCCAAATAPSAAAADPFAAAATPSAAAAAPSGARTADVPASSSSLRASHVQVELAAYQHGSQRLDSKAAEGESASTSSSLPDLGRLTLSDTCTISSEERGGAHSSQPPPLSSALPSQAGSCGGNADGEALEAGAGACSSAELDANGIARIRRQQTMAKIRDMAEVTKAR